MSVTSDFVDIPSAPLCTSSRFQQPVVLKQDATAMTVVERLEDTAQ